MQYTWSSTASLLSFSSSSHKIVLVLVQLAPPWLSSCESSVGKVGLMQLNPSTAAQTSPDEPIFTSSSSLFLLLRPKMRVDFFRFSSCGFRTSGLLGLYSRKCFFEFLFSSVLSCGLLDLGEAMEVLGLQFTGFSLASAPCYFFLVEIVFC